jgi:hypothetical protein
MRALEPKSGAIKKHNCQAVVVGRKVIKNGREFMVWFRSKIEFLVLHEHKRIYSLLADNKPRSYLLIYNSYKAKPH